MPQISEDTAIDQVTERLMRTFPQVSRERVHEIVMGAHDEFRDSVVRDYVPLLVERIAHSKLCNETGTSPTPPCLPDHLAERHFK
jgi:hypothetical protein